VEARVGVFVIELFNAGICRFDFTTTVERINYEGGVRAVKTLPMGQRELRAITQALLKVGISVEEVRQLLEVDSKYTDEQVAEGRWVPKKAIMVNEIVEAVKAYFPDLSEEGK
jgi:hypothetical protein